MIKWLLERVQYYLRVTKTINFDSYPKTVEEVLDDNMKYRPGTDKFLEIFKNSNPWKGTLEEKQNKFRELNENLSKVYGIDTPQLVFVKKFSYGCCYFPIGNLIVMEQDKNEKYSVVTFLHEFGHALGKNEKQTCKWSINLFRRHFANSFMKLKSRGHLLVSENNSETST